MTYRGENVAETFVQHMLQVEDQLINILRKSKPLKILREDEILFQKTTHCHICQKKLESDRVRDHCHVTGKFRGAAHNACNLNLKQKDKIPV